MPIEILESRVLGAVRPVHGATGAQVTGGLVVTARVGGEPAPVRPNRSGLWVLHGASGLQEHTASFDEIPAAPAPGSVEVVVEVTDSAGRFLPRSARVGLPRNPAPDAPAEDSLFVPVDLPLHAAPSAATDRGWSLVRLSLVGDDTGRPLGGALVEVLRESDDEVLARGVSEWRGATAGEALVPVAGIPVATWALGPGEELPDDEEAEDAEDDEDDQDDDAVMIHQVPVRLVVRGGHFGAKASADATDPPGLISTPDPDALAESPPRSVVGDPAGLALRSGHTHHLTVVLEES